jgi:hypothetical protein
MPFFTLYVGFYAHLDFLIRIFSLGQLRVRNVGCKQIQGLWVVISALLIMGYFVVNPLKILLIS